jgi:hypothetical protein
MSLTYNNFGTFNPDQCQDCNDDPLQKILKKEDKNDKSVQKTNGRYARRKADLFYSSKGHEDFEDF